jgi:hypothetical protein
MPAPIITAEAAGGAVNIHPKLFDTLVECVPAYQAAPPVAAESCILK